MPQVVQKVATAEQKKAILERVGGPLRAQVQKFAHLFENLSGSLQGWQWLLSADMPELDVRAVTAAIKWYFYQEGKRARVSFRPDRNLFDVEFSDGSDRYSFFPRAWNATKARVSLSAKAETILEPNYMDDFTILVECCPEFAAEVAEGSKRYMTLKNTYSSAADLLFQDFQQKYGADFDQGTIKSHVGLLSRELRGLVGETPAGLVAALNSKYAGKHEIWEQDGKLEMLAFTLHASSETLDAERGSIRFMALDDTFCVSFFSYILFI